MPKVPAVSREQQLEGLLLEALVYVEDQLDDPCSKKGVVRNLASRIRAAVSKE